MEVERVVEVRETPVEVGERERERERERRKCFTEK